MSKPCFIKLKKILLAKRSFLNEFFFLNWCKNQRNCICIIMYVFPFFSSYVFFQPHITYRTIFSLKNVHFLYHPEKLSKKNIGWKTCKLRQKIQTYSFAGFYISCIHNSCLRWPSLIHDWSSNRINTLKKLMSMNKTRLLKIETCFSTKLPVWIYSGIRNRDAVTFTKLLLKMVFSAEVFLRTVSKIIFGNCLMLTYVVHQNLPCFQMVQSTFSLFPTL